MGHYGGEMLPKETIHSGAKSMCEDCGEFFYEKVMYSNAGYYIGTECCCGPYSRESEYYKSWKEAEKALKTKKVRYRK